MLKLPMATAAKGITNSEHLARREAVENAVTDLRLEGLISSEGDRDLLQRLVEGELTESELLQAVLPK